MADYADDAAGLMAALGWDSAAVLGYSFGGMVAQEFALRHPDRVERLVLMSTSAGGAGGTSYPLHELADLDDEQRVRRFLELADSRRTPQWQLEHAALWQSLIDDGMAALHLGADDPMQRTGSLGQLGARRGHDTWQRLTELKMPVNVYAGRYDTIATPKVQRRLAEQIPGAGYREFEGGHLFFVQDPGAAPVIADALGASSS
jgi:3-oxoadipate enol-lactonase